MHQILVAASINEWAGHVQVEIQDADGQSIPGFSLNDADFIIGDEIDRQVSWTGGKSFAGLSGQPVRLRVKMKDADNYSFRFE